jgi:NTE family protein
MLHRTSKEVTSAGAPFRVCISGERLTAPCPVRLGLALGGGFARGIAHVGVLRVLERYGVPIHCITGISAGAIVAAAYASGTPLAEIARAGCAMRFGDVARFRPRRLGMVSSECMSAFLERLMATCRFEEMRIPLGVIATDLASGDPVACCGSGPVLDPIRASCAYPGLFQPVRHNGRLLVDGAMSAGVPAALARSMGATHVISVPLPAGVPASEPSNAAQVVSRCMQLLQARLENDWRRDTDLVIAPDLRGMDWNAFGRGPELIRAGEDAAMAAIPRIQMWLDGGASAAAA